MSSCPWRSSVHCAEDATARENRTRACRVGRFYLRQEACEISKSEAASQMPCLSVNPARPVSASPMVRLGSEFEDDAVGAHAPLLEVVNDDVLSSSPPSSTPRRTRGRGSARANAQKRCRSSQRWRELCRARWADKPRYALTLRARGLPRARELRGCRRAGARAYDFFERDRQRAFLSADELLRGPALALQPAPAAGGRGPRRACSACSSTGAARSVPASRRRRILEPRAADGSALDADDDEAGEGPAAGTFAMMRDMLAALPELPQQRSSSPTSPHVVSRLDSDWEWLITNDNVTPVSSGTDDVVAYDERLFQTPPAPDHPMLRASTCDAVLNSDYRFCDRSTRPTQTHRAPRAVSRAAAEQCEEELGGRRSCRGRRARRGGRPSRRGAR